LQTLVDAIGARVTNADDLTRSAEPAAQPGEHCGFCSVRPLCSAYWLTTSDPAGLKGGAWFDFEGTVAERNGTKSWWLRDHSAQQNPLLLRTTSAQQVFEPGQRLRLLGVRRDEDPDTDAVVAVLTQTSEVFVESGESDY
jgi:hypothetical protein